MKILFAYDELYYMLSTIENLEDDGHTVVCVSSSEEAKKILGEDPENFDLAIVGVGNCLKGGEYLIKKVNKEVPDLKIIAISTWEGDLDFCKGLGIPTLLLAFRFEELQNLINSLK